MTESLDLDALEAVARAATPGPWLADWEQVTTETHPGTLVFGGHFESNDAAHLAAFDPPTVLALIGRVREAEADLKLTRNLADQSRQFYDWGSEQRDRAEAAEALIERIREARANHPVCDVHPDGDAVTCGWKATVIDIDRALGR